MRVYKNREETMISKRAFMCNDSPMVRASVRTRTHTVYQSLDRLVGVIVREQPSDVLALIPLESLL